MASAQKKNGGATMKTLTVLTEIRDNFSLKLVKWAVSEHQT